MATLPYRSPGSLRTVDSLLPKSSHQPENAGWGPWPPFLTARGQPTTHPLPRWAQSESIEKPFEKGP
jgi:hypothetical protein